MTKDDRDRGVLILKPVLNQLPYGLPFDARVKYNLHSREIQISIYNLSGVNQGEPEKKEGEFAAWLVDNRGIKKRLGTLYKKGSATYTLKQKNINLTPGFDVLITVSSDTNCYRPGRVILSTRPATVKQNDRNKVRTKDKKNNQKSRNKGKEKTNEGLKIKKEGGKQQIKELTIKEKRFRNKAKKEQSRNRGESESISSAISKEEDENDPVRKNKKMEHKKEEGLKKRNSPWDGQDDTEEGITPGLLKIDSEKGTLYLYQDGERIMVFRYNPGGSMIVVGERRIDGSLGFKFIDPESMRFYQPFLER